MRSARVEQRCTNAVDIGYPSASRSVLHETRDRGNVDEVVTD